METTQRLTIHLFESDQQCLYKICRTEKIHPHSISWLIRYIIRQYCDCIQIIPYEFVNHLDNKLDPNTLTEQQRKEIGKRISYLRQTKRMSMKQFGEMFNVSRQMVSKWEKGSIPKENILDAMAKKFNVNKEWIKGE